MTVISNSNPLGYDGVRAPNPPNLIVSKTADPTSTQFHFPLGTLWLNQSDGDLFYLSQVVANVATWTLISLAAGTVDTLTGDTGGALSPTAGNINILGGTGISVAGSGSTLTINSVGEGEKTVVLTADQNPAATNTSYINNKTANSTLTLTLGATGYAVGDVVRLTGLTSHNTGGNYWILQANAAGAFHDGSMSGAAGGTITCTSQYGSVTVMAEAVSAGAVTDWAVISATGTLAVA